MHIGGNYTKMFAATAVKTIFRQSCRRQVASKVSQNSCISAVRTRFVRNMDELMEKSLFHCSGKHIFNEAAMF